MLQADRARYPEVLRGSELGMLEEETGGLSEPRKHHAREQGSVQQPYGADLMVHGMRFGSCSN